MAMKWAARRVVPGICAELRRRWAWGVFCVPVALGLGAAEAVEHHTPQQVSVDVIAVAEGVLMGEESIRQLEQRLFNLKTRAQSVRARVHKTRAAAQRQLLALTRLSLIPPQILLTSRAQRDERLQTGILLRGILSNYSRTTAHQQQLAQELSTLKPRVSWQLARLEHQVLILKLKQKDLEALALARKTEQPGFAARAQEAARQATSLGDLSRGFFRDRPDAPDVPSAPESSPQTLEDRQKAEEETSNTLGPKVVLRPKTAEKLEDEKMLTLRTPAVGTMTTTYGDALYGLRAGGILIATRPGAQVVAPASGTVVYAGPFRNFGHIVLLAYDAQTHFLLADLARVVVGIGQRLQAGAPVGTMAANGANPKLYVELRIDGRAVAPDPLLAGRLSRTPGNQLGML